MMSECNSSDRIRALALASQPFLMRFREAESLRDNKYMLKKRGYLQKVTSSFYIKIQSILQ